MLVFINGLNFSKALLDFSYSPFKWYALAKLAFPLGYPQTAYVGACALVAVISGKKLYVANAGDCKGVLLSTNSEGNLEAKNLSTTFSANKKYEQERLKKQFPQE